MTDAERYILCSPLKPQARLESMERHLFDDRLLSVKPEEVTLPKITHFVRKNLDILSKKQRSKKKKFQIFVRKILGVVGAY